MTTSTMVKSIEFCKLFCAVDNLVTVRRRFHDQAAHCQDHSIAKEDFLKLFAIAPDHASHVFDLFDYYHRNAIHYNNFLLAFSIFSNATNAEKVNLIRDIFCAGGDREIRRPELIQIVDLILDSACNMMGVNVHDPMYVILADRKAKSVAEGFLTQQQQTRPSISFNDLYYLVEAHNTFSELRTFILEAGLRANELFGCGTDRFPLQHMPNERFELNSLGPICIPTELIPHPVSSDDFSLHRFIFPEYCVKGFNAAAFPCDEIRQAVRGKGSSIPELWHRAPHAECDFSRHESPSWASTLGPLALQGYVYKRSWFFRRLKRRWIVLKNNILYSFHNHSSLMPNIVIPLAGAICNAIADDAVEEDSEMLSNDMPRFALQLVSPLSHLTRIISLPTAAQRDRWVQAINIASMDFNLADHYQMFSVIHPSLPNVFECKGAHSGQHYMLKYIEKKHVNEADLQLMRIESGVLRFLDHPDIASSVAIYEDPTKIYLIRHYIPLGWVRIDEILGARGILSVNSVALIMRQVISGLTYLHRVGLTLGAFGPTNILMRLDSLRQHRVHIVDIGLRKFFVQELDDESRSYVAPEVVNGTRPGPKADMWSVGTIMYRLLTPGSTRKDIETAKEIHLDVSRTKAPAEVIKTVKRLLNRTPSKRYSAVDTLRQRWIRDAVEGPFQLRLPRRHYMPQSLPMSLRSGHSSTKSITVTVERLGYPSKSEKPSVARVGQF